MASAVPITSAPAAGQLVEHEGTTYETIREGRAHILIPPGTQKSVDPQNKAKADPSLKPQNVFYNPIQQFNRDLSVIAIKAFGEDWLVKRQLQKSKEKEKPRKKNKKRKRAEANVGEADEEDGGVKLPKTTDITSPDHDEAASSLVKQADHAEPPASKLTNQKTGNEDAANQGQGNGRTEDEKDPKANGQPPKPAGPQFRILDALSATGLRALRYAKEIPFVTTVVANDMNPNATKSMALNIQHNGLSSYIIPNTGDAIGHMYSVAYPPPGSHGPQHLNKKYDVVDLDPYGTAAPFLDAAIQATNDGGLLCVTCTDSGVFASTGYCEKTFSLYGGMPVKGPYMHEGGLRLIIHSIASTAAKYGISIEPLLSLSIDFYIRVFVRIKRSPADVKFLAGKTMLVYSCDHGCGAWTTNLLGRNMPQEAKDGTKWYKHSIGQAPNADRLCEHCGSKTHIAGPMWAGPIHNAAFVEKMLDDLRSADKDVYETIPRMEGMLTTALDELVVNKEVTKYTPPASRKEGEDVEMVPKVPPATIDNHPFFFNPSTLSKVIHCVAPGSAAMNGALRHAGYIATRSHCQAGCIKTDAPWSVIWEIMREWTRQRQPIKEGALKENTPGFRIMQAARNSEGATNGDGHKADKASDSPEIITEPGGKSPSDTSKRIKVVFDEVLGKDKPGKRLVRYQVNPRENWGPMTKAKGSANATTK